MVWGPHIWIEEELSRILVGPVIGNGISFLLILFYMGDNCLQVSIFPNELKSAMRSYFGDRIEVVAAKENAEVDELFSRRVGKLG